MPGTAMPMQSIFSPAIFFISSPMRSPTSLPTRSCTATVCLKTISPCSVKTARESFVPPRSIAKAVIDLNISNPLRKDKHVYRKSNKKGSGEFAALHRTCSRLLLLFQQFELFCIPSLPDLDEIQPGFQVTSNRHDLVTNKIVLNFHYSACNIYDPDQNLIRGISC